MQYNPDTERIILGDKILRGFGGIYESRIFVISTVFGRYLVGNHNILESHFLAHVVELQIAFSLFSQWTDMVVSCTFGRLIPGKMMLEQYASAMGHHQHVGHDENTRPNLNLWLSPRGSQLTL